MSTLHGHRKRLANEEADDLRVEQIAAQLEEAEQQRLAADWIGEPPDEDFDLGAGYLPSRHDDKGEGHQ